MQKISTMRSASKVPLFAGSCLSHSSTPKMGAERSSETSLEFHRLYGVTSHKKWLLNKSPVQVGSQWTAATSVSCNKKYRSLWIPILLQASTLEDQLLISSKEKSKRETGRKWLRGYWKRNNDIFWRKLWYFGDNNLHKSGKGLGRHSNQLNQISKVTIFPVL
jgi:hypothetical protein